MDKLEKIITDDGSISFYNKEIGDIYHSKIGAYTESLEKFITPSDILNRLDNTSCINVLDVCFGLGYNSKVLLNFVLSLHRLQKINLTCIEIDPQILLKSIEINFEGYDPDLKLFFDSFLHKTYYATVQNSSFPPNPFSDSLGSFALNLFVDDARNVVASLNSTFDLIFLDPFSPQKSPSLWTLNFIQHLYRLLNHNGSLITYSSSSSIRGAMIDSGFFIGNTLPVGRKSPGTIAYKQENFILHHLSRHQNELLASKSGIPFYDPNLNWSDTQIFNYRKELQNSSTRKSASSIRKSIC